MTRGRDEFLEDDKALRGRDVITPDRRGHQRTGKCTGTTEDGRSHDNGLRSRKEIARTIDRAEKALTKQLIEFGTRPMPGNKCPVPGCGSRLSKTKLCLANEDHTPRDEAARIVLGPVIKDIPLPEVSR